MCTAPASAARRRGPAPRLLPYGPEIDSRYTAGGREYDVGAFMDRNAIVGALAIHRGHVVLERYGLGLGEQDRWSTMSTVKSMTAMLVGAAVHDGAIKSIDEPLTKYLPALAGSEPLSPERQEGQGAGCCKVRRAIRRTAT